MFFRLAIPLILLGFSSVALSQNKPELTIYSYSSFNSEWGPGARIKEKFETICDCQLKMVSLDDGVVMLNRLKMEGKNSPADVVIGLDNYLMPIAEKTGLFAAHQIETPSLQLPWQNAFFIPYDYSYFAFVYRKDKIAEPPTHFDELLNNEQNWKIIYPDPRSSTPGLGLLLWMQTLYGDDVTNKWQQLKAHTVTVPKGWSEAYGLFLKGEADFVLSYSTSPIVHWLNDKDSRYAAAEFSEGHVQQIEIAGMLKNSQHPELARQFLAFLLTPEIQTLLATKNMMYPVVDVPLPHAFDAYPPIQRKLDIQPETLEKHQKQWITTWRNAVSQ